MWSRSFFAKFDEDHKINAGYPTSVKEHEVKCINYGLVNLEDKFSLVEGVKYLWVFTHNEMTNEPGEIYLGVENPVMFPQAFHEKSEGNLIEKKQKLEKTLAKIKADAGNAPIDDEIKSAMLDTGFSNRGHATLAVKYDTNGKVLPTKAYIGGKLGCSEDGTWYLNNRSGRFHHVLENMSKDDKEMLLRLIAQQIKQHKGIEPVVKVISYKRAPEGIWKRNFKDYLSLIDVALIFILKVFKYIIPEGFDDKKQRILSKETLEYLAIKKYLYDQKFRDLNKFIQFLSHETFNETVKNILKKYDATILEKIETDLNIYIEFLRTKANLNAEYPQVVM